MYTAAYVGTNIFSLVYGPNFLFFSLNSIGQLAKTSTESSLRKHASVYGSNFVISVQRILVRPLLLLIEPGNLKIL